MGPLIPLALGLASKYVPDLFKSAFGSDKAAEVANIVIDTAKAATGCADSQQALAGYKGVLEQNPQLQLELMSKVADVLQMQVNDIQHARETLRDDATTSKLAYLIMFGNIPLIGGSIALLVWVTTSGMTEGTLATVSAIIGGCLNQLYQERQQVMNYRFGSSVGEKLRGLFK
ncbi:putative DNA topoisomerase [Edwardsiella phage vB_EpP_ZHX]|nr:putative DNA topoisomerase [Edwardsiella phage vB_EpP_ZHX]